MEGYSVSLRKEDKEMGVAGALLIAAGAYLLIKWVKEEKEDNK